MDVGSVPAYVLEVLRSLAARGHFAYLVGGCVRDMLIGRPVHDWDAATSAKPKETGAAFAESALTGERYGTVTVFTGGGSVEVTTFRSEGAYSDGRHPDGVCFLTDVTADLARRDFTVNAMALSAEGELIDPFGGGADIERGLLRCVGDPSRRFGEDALRMFRALRFSAELGFEIESGTLAAIEKNAGLAASVAAERISAETERMLLSGRPEIIGEGISLGLYSSAGVKAKPPVSGLEGISAVPRDRLLRWAALCAVLAENGNIKDAAAFLRALRLSRRIVDSCPARAVPFPGEKAEIKRLLVKLGCERTLCAAAADRALYGTDAIARVRAVLDSGECASLASLKVNGGDIRALGFEGRDVGRVLGALLERVIDEPGENEKNRLLELARSIGGQSPQSILQ